MQMKQKIVTLAVALWAVMSVVGAQAQEDWKILVGADYDMYFDNRELVD